MASSCLFGLGFHISAFTSLSLASGARFPPSPSKSYSSVLMEDCEAKPIDLAGGFLVKKAYDLPSWASHLNPIPSHIYSLGHFPTPIHKWNLPNLPENTEIWIKRDDLSGLQLSGNKVRKLEFLLADAVAHGADCVITAGGIQSNHCRATAVAARYLNLDCHLILRTSKLLVNEDPGLTGNLLVERLVGANIELVSKEEYAKIGSVALTDILKERLINEGRKPYVIPVGGSNSLGTWGYIETIREIEQQTMGSFSEVHFDDIVVACGSGGTIAGLALGSTLSNLKAKVHAFSVCDDPDYFYHYCQGLLDGLQAGVNSRDIVNIQDAKGLGYAISNAAELQFIKEIAESTGVILDPVYGYLSAIVSFLLGPERADKIAIFAGDVVPKRKPDPAIYLLAANTFGIEPSSCVVVENSAIGLAAAKATGMKCIITKSGYTAEENFLEVDAVFDCIGDPPNQQFDLEFCAKLLQKQYVS